MLNLALLFFSFIIAKELKLKLDSVLKEQFSQSAG